MWGIGVNFLLSHLLVSLLQLATQKENGKIWDYISNICVYARMTPEGKERLSKKMKEQVCVVICVILFLSKVMICWMLFSLF